ncbi:MAG: sugar transferase [Bryobacterales bacterium]
MPDEHRMTALGRFFVAGVWTKHPQLLNVLRGRMSLIGFRVRC